MTTMPTRDVCLVGTIEEASLSPDSGFRSDSREGHFATKISPPPTDDNQCSLCCDRTRAVSQLPTCLHSFCQMCLEQLCQSPLQSCPKCQSNVQLSRIGLSAEACEAKEPVPMGSLDLLCAQCKTGSVVANCVQCIQLLCKNCSSSHDSSHAVFKLDAIGSGAGGVSQNCDEGNRHYGDKKALCTLASSAPRKPFRLLDFSMSLRDIFQSKTGNGQDLCQEHRSEVARYYCQSYKQPICGLCSTQGGCLGHEFVMLSDVLKEQNGSMSFAVEQSKAKTNDLLSSVTHLDCVSCQLKEQFEESLSNIEKTFGFFSRVLLEHNKDEMVLKLKNVHTSMENFLNSTRKELMRILADLKEGEMLLNTLQPLPSVASLIPLKRDILEKVDRLLEYKPDIDGSSVAFVSNHQAIQTAVRNTFGYVRHNQKNLRSVTRIFAGSESSTPCSFKGGDSAPPAFVGSQQNGQKSSFETSTAFNQSFQGSSASDLAFFQPKTRPACGSVDGNGRSGTIQTRIPSKAHANHSANQNFVVPQKLPGSTSDSSRMLDYLSTTSGPSLRGWTVALGLGGPDTEDDMSKVIVSNVSPALLTRTKMQYHCKFGEYGNEAGQFTEPSGVTVNHLNEILVADANNHRIQIFDRNGNFKCVVGKGGKGDLVYPNQLAVNMQTGDIFVTQRSPTHQVQVYNQHGRFIRRFGAHILQHPRGPGTGSPVLALQVIAAENDHSFNLNVAAPERILYDRRVRDSKIVVLIAGAFRKGRSFLLYFFLRYLYARADGSLKRKHNIVAWIRKMSSYACHIQHKLAKYFYSSSQGV